MDIEKMLPPQANPAAMPKTLRQSWNRGANWPSSSALTAHDLLSTNFKINFLFTSVIVQNTDYP
ncbi:hypothetical protein [Stappia sp. MMSF_3263]|uniref:hypothetical protein n=1 Tax=Stappia sp. MMSF_3263 TaxID=3046693 RepID=UPI00273EE677|nr:hypothetical protein [Stappia sp. MMSF_3263]